MATEILTAIVCDTMRLELAPDVIARAVTEIKDDRVRVTLLNCLDATPVGVDVIVPTTVFDSLLDAVAEQERAMFGLEERDGDGA